jgi:hypothetical protein
MRGTLWAIGLLVAMAAASGCHHDKYNLRPKKKEEVFLPTDDKRYNEPETMPWKKPPPPKEEKTLLGRPGPGMGPGGMGGFGP